MWETEPTQAVIMQRSPSFFREWEEEEEEDADYIRENRSSRDGDKKEKEDASQGEAQ